MVSKVTWVVVLMVVMVCVCVWGGSKGKTQTPCPETLLGPDIREGTRPGQWSRLPSPDREINDLEADGSCAQTTLPPRYLFSPPLEPAPPPRPLSWLVMTRPVHLSNQKPQSHPQLSPSISSLDLLSNKPIWKPAFLLSTPAAPVSILRGADCKSLPFSASSFAVSFPHWAQVSPATPTVGSSARLQCQALLFSADTPSLKCPSASPPRKLLRIFQGLMKKPHASSL